MRDGTHNSPKYQREGYPLVTSKNLVTNGIDLSEVSFISKYDYQEINKRSKVETGDILFGMIGTIGNPVIVKKGGFAIKNVALIKHGGEVSNGFLLYLLKSSTFLQYIRKENAGGTQKFLGLSVIRSFKFKVPDKVEQGKIASIFNSLNRLITLQQRKLEQLMQLKKAMLQQLFVDKNNKQPNSRFKNFKGDWEQHILEEVAQVTMGQSPSSKNYTDNPNDYVLVQGNADLKSNEISPRVWTKEVTKQVHKGEFIITVRAPVGYLAMANIDAVIGRGVAAIDGNKYLYYLLQTKLLDRTWEKLSSGSTFESISSNDIKNLEIKVTENEEEKLIAKLMDTVTCLLTFQQSKIDQLTILKRYLLQKLFI